jgi:phosphate transport system substrate-binding protein
MKKNHNKGISTLYAALGMIILLIIGIAAGYYLKPIPASTQEFPEDSTWRTASISIAGSTTVLPIGQTNAIAFMNTYNETTITVQGGGSGAGYAQLIDGVIDIAMASRPPKQTEIDNQQGVDLWLHPTALDAVCVVVHPSVNSSLKLTLQQVGKIYSGNITRWNEIDPDLPDEEIYVVVRESGSGTRGTFEEYTMDPWDYIVDSSKVHELPSNPAVKNAIETTSYSIGYVGFGFLSDDMVAAALANDEGEAYVHPTLANIQEGNYPISRYLYFVTSSPPASGSLNDRFIEFILSSTGQQLVESEGFLALPVNYNYP